MSPPTYSYYVYIDGNRYWMYNRTTYREDGPAVEYADGREYWYLGGEPLWKGGPTISVDPISWDDIQGKQTKFRKSFQ